MPGKGKCDYCDAEMTNYLSNTTYHACDNPEHNVAMEQKLREIMRQHLYMGDGGKDV